MLFRTPFGNRSFPGFIRAVWLKTKVSDRIKVSGKRGGDDRNDENRFADNQDTTTNAFTDNYAASAGMGREAPLDEFARPRNSLQDRHRHVEGRRGNRSARSSMGGGVNERWLAVYHRQ